MSVFMYLRGFDSFKPLERFCDFAKFWCGKNSWWLLYPCSDILDCVMTFEYA